MHLITRNTSFGSRLAAGFTSIKAMCCTAIVALMGFSGAAMAAGSGPNVSAITSEFDTYKVAVVGLVIAFAVVLWAIRAAGLLKPR